MLVIAALNSCESAMPVDPPPAQRREINSVLADHDKRLLAMPGVVGVCVGLLEDNSTLCLRVMLAKDDPNVRCSIPRTIEGYRVVTEVTGEFKPLTPPPR